VLLVRHGQTAWNAQGRFLGRTDLPLDEVGLAQARLLGERLAWTGPVVSSPARRALQTALAIGPEVSVEADFRELDQGFLEGLDRQAATRRYGSFFEQFQRDPLNTAAPGGEALGEALVRFDRALRRWALTLQAPFALVGHQLVLAGWRCQQAGLPVARWRSLALENAGWVAVDVETA
jgi:probable phosphoglycerate mutase